MQSRRINTITWSIAALFACGAAVVLALGALLPLASGAGSNQGSALAAATRDQKPASHDAAIDASLDRALRQPLSDAPPLHRAVAPAAIEQAPLALVGTVGNSLALIRRADGTVELRSVGESIDGAELTAIHAGQVELRRDGNRTVLKKPAEPQP